MLSFETWRMSSAMRPWVVQVQRREQVERW